jgi:hypothetical protein
LDNLGIVFDAQEVYGDWAEKIGDVDGVLDETQKTQALYNEVLEVGNELMVKQGGLAADNATQFERLNANFENSANNFKSWAADVFSVVPAGLNLALYGESAEEAFGFGLDFVNTNTEYFDSYNDYLNSVASGLESSGMISQGFGDVFLEMYKNRDLLDQLPAFNEKFGPYISSSERLSFSDTEREIYNLSKAFESLLIQTGRQNDLEIGNFEDYMMSLGLVSEETFNASQEVAEFYEQNTAIGQSAFTASGALWEQAYATTGYSEATWEAMHAASALETAEKEKNDALLEAGNIMDQLKTKTSQLEAAQLSWGLSVSNDIVSKLEAAGISGEKLEGALSALDQKFGSSHLLEYQQNQFIEDLIADLADPDGSLESFTSGLEELENAFMPLDQDIQAISTDIMTLQMQLSALERTYNVDVVLDISGDLSELGIPSVSENALEGADYLGGSGSAERGSGSDHDQGFAFGTSFTVPAGYPNDSYLWSTYLSSGEHVSVNPSGAGGGGGGQGGIAIENINVQIDHEGDLGEIDVRALAEAIAAEFRSGL